MDDDAGAPDPGELVLVHVRAYAPDPTHRAFGRLGFAGEVESVGKRVSAFRPGDAVYGVGIGAFGDYLCVPQHEIAHMPASLDSASAATVPLPGFTAVQNRVLLVALIDAGALTPSASTPPDYT